MEISCESTRKLKSQHLRNVILNLLQYTPYLIFIYTETPEKEEYSKIKTNTNR